MLIFFIQLVLIRNEAKPTHNSQTFSALLVLMQLDKVPKGVTCCELLVKMTTFLAYIHGDFGTQLRTNCITHQLELYSL